MPSETRELKVQDLKKCEKKFRNAIDFIDGAAIDILGIILRVLRLVVSVCNVYKKPDCGNFTGLRLFSVW
jgi:hypothetical protein